MNSNKKIKKTDLSITVLLVVGILIVVNFFSYQIFHRWDLTQNKIYSISPVSRNIAKNLDDVVNVKVYFSDNLPYQVAGVKQEVSDILEEYANYSNGHIKVEYLSPGTDEKTMQEMSMKGIAPLTFQVVEKDKMEAVNGYMGIVIEYGTKSETIPAVKQDTSDLEYQITSTIKRVIGGKTLSIGFVSSNGTTNRETLKTVYQKLQEVYSVRDVNLDSADEKLDDVDTLIIAGPTKEFTDQQFKKIDSFLSRGGDLMVLADGVTINTTQGLSANKNATNIGKLLNKYGITLNNDLVLDTKAGVISFTQNNFPFPIRVKYPFWPQITGDGFNKKYGAVASLENIVLPWTSSVSVDASKIGQNNFSYLVSTSDASWTVQDNFDINPNLQPTPKDQKKHNLAVAINGGLKSAYGQDSSKMGRMIVVGDSEFILDSFLQNSPDNLTFFQNLVDSMSLGDDLINIRSKVVVSRPINKGEDFSDSDRNLIRFSNVFGMTVLVVTFGMVRYYMRRKSNFSDDL